MLQSTSRSVQCTTNELNALNARLRDASNDCIVLTEQARKHRHERWLHGGSRPMRWFWLLVTAPLAPCIIAL